MADGFYQAVNFHFAVKFDMGGNEKDADMRFQSVTGMDSTVDTETIKEGGENHFEHIVPTRRRYGPLVLKRGILTRSSSAITTWLQKAFDKGEYQVIPTALILLLDEDHQPLMHWRINNVWPRSWKLGELNAERGEVLIETLELNYNYLLFNP